MAAAAPVAVFLGKALIGASSSAIANFIGTTASSLLIGSAIRKLTPRPDISVNDRDLGRNITDPVASLPVIYGEARVGVHRIYLETTAAGGGSDKLYLWIVAAVCHGPIAGLDEIHFDGREVIDANGRPSASVSIDGTSYSFVSYAHVWKAYGTDSQVTVVEKAVGAKTVTSSVVGANVFRRVIDTSAAHGYVVGDIITPLTTVAGLTAGKGYGVVQVNSTTEFVVEVPEGGGITSGSSGTVDHYTPDLDTLFGTNWSSEHRGRGVAYLVFRLRYNEDRFPAGLPRIEVNVRGIVARDPRAAGTLTITSSAPATAVTGMASTSQIATSAAHSLSVGDIVEIWGHSDPLLNGLHRVDRIVDTDEFVINTPHSGGTGSGGIVLTRAHTSNPAICIRDYLTSKVYGPGLTAGYRGAPGTIVVARKSTSQGGSPPATASLQGLGYTVTEDLTATVAECRAYDIVVIDCNAWNADEHNAFIQQLWADGQKVIVSGNDSTTGLFYIATTEGVTPVGTAEPGDDADHPIGQGFTSFADADSGTRITAVQDFALPLGTYDENAAAFPWVVVAHPSGGCIVHLHTPRIGDGAGAQAAIVINNVMGFLTGWASAEVDEATISTEANYHDEDVDAVTPNGASFTNTREVTGATGDGTHVTFTTSSAHGYADTDVVRVSGFAQADDLDGIYDVFDLPSSTTVRVALAKSGSWTPELVRFFDEEGFQRKARFGRIASQVTQNRFECHGVLDTTQTVKKNIEDLLTSCRGSLLYQAGTYRTHTRRATTAHALVLSEANIVGDWEFSGPGVSDLANVVRCAFYDATKSYAVNQVQVPGPDQPNGFRTDDNGIVILRDLDLRYTTNADMAKQIAHVVRREARNPIRCAVTCFEAALALSVGDVVQVTHETPGWSLKKFWVGAMAILQTGHVRLVLEEYEETAYDLDATDDTPFAPDTQLAIPGPRDPIAVPTDLSIAAVEVDTPTGIAAFLKVTFTAPQLPFYARMEYRVRFRNRGTGVYGQSATIPGTTAGPDLLAIAYDSDRAEITPIAVTTGGATTEASPVVVVLSDLPIADPSFGTPIAGSTSITYPVTYDRDTAAIHAWSEEHVSVPSLISVENAGDVPSSSPLRRDDGRTGLSIPIASASNYLRTTLVAYDHLGRRGTFTTFVTQGASPPTPPPPTAVNVTSETDTTMSVDVTMPSDISNFAAIRVFRNGVQWGADITRTAAASAVQAVVHTGLAPATMYEWKYRGVSAAGVESTTFSPSDSGTTDPGTIPEPSIDVSEYDLENEGFTVVITPAPGTPSGVMWHVEHSIDGGAFSEEESSTLTNIFHDHPPAGSGEVCDVRVFGTKFGWVNSPTTGSIPVDIPPA